eukprot:7246390-Pyramimonas_sp.AAC.1
MRRIGHDGRDDSRGRVRRPRRGPGRGWGPDCQRHHVRVRCVLHRKHRRRGQLDHAHPGELPPQARPSLDACAGVARASVRGGVSSPVLIGYAHAALESFCASARAAVGEPSATRAVSRQKENRRETERLVAECRGVGVVGPSPRGSGSRRLASPFACGAPPSEGGWPSARASAARR